MPVKQCTFPIFVHPQKVEKKKINKIIFYAVLSPNVSIYKYPLNKI